MERDRYHAEGTLAASLYGASASTSEAASQRSRATIDRGLEILGVRLWPQARIGSALIRQPSVIASTKKFAVGPEPEVCGPVKMRDEQANRSLKPRWVKGGLQAMSA
jgi:hypothetical protein